MAKTFNSFVYDIKAIFNPGIINGMCYGYFRLSPEYKDSGATFGFDWIRTGDAKKYVGYDEPYNLYVGRYYEATGGVSVCSMSDFNKLTFLPDKKLYKKLCNSYPISNLRIFPSPRRGRDLYHVPVLSIYPYSGNDRDIAKLILQLKIYKSPAKISFEYNTEHLEINGIENIPTQKGYHNLELSIKCVQEFSEDEYIRVVSFNSKGKRKNAGMIRVCKNKKQLRRGMKVLIVNTKFLISNKEDAMPLVGDVENAKLGITRFLRHALINPEFDIIELDLGYHGDLILRIANINGNRALILKKYQTEDGVTKLVEKTEKMLQMLTTPLKQIINTENYDTIVFCLGEKLARIIDNRLSYLAGTTVGKNILLRKGYSPTTACHETLHTLGLAHTFMNTAYLEENLSEYTYKIYKTDNLMDYQKENKRTNLWEWQWKKIRSKGFPEI